VAFALPYAGMSLEACQKCPPTDMGQASYIFKKFKNVFFTKLPTELFYPLLCLNLFTTPSAQE
jgi:hypothetical protein